MGTTAWKGDALHSGYRVFICGKEVELDCRVSLEQLPSLVGGPSEALENDMTLVREPLVGQDDPASLVDSPVKASSKFVAPTSFYGAPPPSKPRPTGPL